MFNDNPYKHCVAARTTDEYKILPLQSRERAVWYWPFPLYITPYALSAGQDGELTSEWDKFDMYIKKQYPVQYFFRKIISNYLFEVKYRCTNIAWKVKRYIKFPRKEMRDKIFIRDFRDLDSIIAEFCIQCVIEYVDREKCFKHVEFNSNDESKTFAAQLKECHDYAINGRVTLHSALEKAWEDVPMDNSPGMSKYNKVHELEVKITEADSQVCEWVIKNRAHLWT